MKLGLIGAGSIGKFLVEQINQHEVARDSRFIAAFDERKPVALEGLRAFSDLEAFITCGIDACVEATNVASAKTYVIPLLRAGISVILCSVGCLADEDFYASAVASCTAGHTRLYVPSGAIGGLDAIQAAAAIGGLQHVSIVTRKPATALGVSGGNAGSITDHGSVSRSVISGPDEVLFDGAAYEAIQQFPKNVNSSIALSCAGLGARRTTVRIVMDPKIDRNEHVIKAVGDFGELHVRVSNAAMPTNPKTSYLAALSVLALIRKIGHPIQVGV